MAYRDMPQMVGHTYADQITELLRREKTAPGDDLPPFTG